MVAKNRILVPLGANLKDLDVVHHALALAERIDARLYFLKYSPPEEQRDKSSLWLEEAMLDLVVVGHEEGLDLNYLIVRGSFEEEVLAAIREKKINIVVIGTEDDHLEKALLRLRSEVPGQIIQVKHKDNVTYL